METIEQLKRLIIDFGLEGKMDAICQSAKPSIRLKLEIAPVALCPGSSRMGGSPELPSAEDWPRRGRSALAFICQVRLADIAKMEAAKDLPSDGLLSFFYELEEMVWGFGTEHRSGWRVLHFEDPARLRRVEEPAGIEPAQRLPEHRITFVPSLTLPALRSIESMALNIKDDEFTAFWELRDKVAGLADEETDSSAVHRMFGHPDAMQGCMQRTVQFASRDEQLPEGVSSYYEHPRAEELIPGAFDWLLLLQIDSDERLKVMFGDAGRIFFWMHRGDLADRRFENTWLFLQCG